MLVNTTISACLIVRDEERLLPECLDSLRPVVDEIVVADTGSKDATAEVAQAGGARVIHHAWSDDFSVARNAALEEARGDWILVLDADERLEWEGYGAFREPLTASEQWGYLLNLVNLHEEGASEVLLLRLFRNHPGVRFSGIIHERVDSAIARVAGDMERAVGRHAARIIHSGYLPARRVARGKDERDIRLLKKQIAADRTDPYFWYKFAAHPHAREHLIPEVDQALWTAWSLILEKDPGGTVFGFSQEVAALLILSYLSRRDLKRVGSLASQAGRMARTSPNLEYALGVAALAGENLESAADHLEAALSYAGCIQTFAPFEGITGPRTLLALSEARYLQGKRDESSRLFSKASALTDGEPVNAFFGAPRTLTRIGDPGWAVLLLTLAARFMPSDPFPLKRGGEILLELGLFEKAYKWLDYARKLAPGDEGIMHLLGDARAFRHPV